MNDMHHITQFKATGLDNDTLRHKATSIFAAEPMSGLSHRYAFVPTIRVVDGLRERRWVPVAVEEQRIRKESRRGFQKHLIRFRRIEQMESLDEWNVELVLVNSHDAGCAYQIHAGIYRRICRNGLVLSEESFQALRVRHTGDVADEVVQGSLRLLEDIPKVSALVERFSQRMLGEQEALALAGHGLKLRYGSLACAPVDPDILLRSRRFADSGSDLWRTTNRVQENLIRGGVYGSRRDRRGVIRSVRPLRAIDAKVTLNKGLWSAAERLAKGESLSLAE